MLVLAALSRQIEAAINRNVLQVSSRRKEGPPHVHNAIPGNIKMSQSRHPATLVQRDVAPYIVNAPGILRCALFVEKESTVTLGIARFVRRESFKAVQKWTVWPAAKTVRLDGTALKHRQSVTMLSVQIFSIA